MILNELLGLERDYEIGSVGDFLKYLEDFFLRVEACLDDGASFKIILDETMALIKSKQPSSEDIDSLIKRLRDIAPFASKINFPDQTRMTKTVFFYRGVYDGIKFNLLPSALRSNRFGKEVDYYHYVKAQCANDYKDLSQINTLVRMQHYECPTRLMDLTSNPLVALYFASKNFGCTHCNKADYGYVYIFLCPDNQILFDSSDKAVVLSCLAKLNLSTQKKIYRKCLDEIKQKGFGVELNGRNSKAVEKLYHEIRQERDFDKRLLAFDLLRNYYFQPDMTNNRVKIQSGAFLIPGLHEDQQEYLDSLNYEYFIRIKIKNQAKILKELDRLNINEASLFPEADKVAHYFTEKI